MASTVAFPMPLHPGGSSNEDLSAQMNEDAQDIVEKQPESIDAIIANELNQLSLKERNKIDEEIHGVSTPYPKETPELLEKALFELALELDNISDKNLLKDAYMKTQMNPDTYVNAADFRLRFLRCELFDAKKAAHRLITFLDHSSDLFGPAVLKRPLMFKDLSPDAKKFLLNGYFQPLPYRDRSGRAILVWVGDFGMEEDTIPRWQACLYIFVSLSESIESQRKGVNILVWVGNNTFAMSYPAGEMGYVKRHVGSIPLRLSVFHCCLPDRPYCHVFRAAIGLMLGAYRTRLKFHVGERVELLYTLKTYGIPVELIPVTETGNIKTTYNKQWIKTCKHLNDDTSPSSSIIVCPKSNDVIFRRGTSLLCHPGNSMFQNIIESKLQVHFSASQNEKVAITRAIIQTVLEEKKGRFLQWDTRGWWTEVDDESQLHAKVAKQVRLLTGKLVASKNQTSRDSSTRIFQNQDNHIHKNKRRRLIPVESDGSNSDCSGCGVQKGCWSW